MYLRERPNHLPPPLQTKTLLHIAVKGLEFLLFIQYSPPIAGLQTRARVMRKPISTSPSGGLRTDPVVGTSLFLISPYDSIHRSSPFPVLRARVIRIPFCQVHISQQATQRIPTPLSAHHTAEGSLQVPSPSTLSPNQPQSPSRYEPTTQHPSNKLITTRHDIVSSISAQKTNGRTLAKYSQNKTDGQLNQTAIV
jgi:hypothetical protein